MKEFYAHSLEGKPTEEWHRLEEHGESAVSGQLPAIVLLRRKLNAER